MSKHTVVVVYTCVCASRVVRVCGMVGREARICKRKQKHILCRAHVWVYGRRRRRKHVGRMLMLNLGRCLLHLGRELRHPLLYIVLGLLLLVVG